MGILSVKPHFQGGRFTRKKDGESSTRVFVVQTTGRDTDAYAVGLAPRIPRIGDRHPSDSRLVCVNVDPHLQDSSENLWHVAVEYEDEEKAGGNNNFQENEPPPFDSRIPRIQIQTVDRTKPMEKDAYGKSVINSAGTRFVNVPEYEASITEISINGRCAFEKFTPKLIDEFRDKLNADQFFGYDKLKCKIKNITAVTEDLTVTLSNGKQKTTTVWSIGIQVHVQESWVLEVMDEGHLQNEGGTTGMTGYSSSPGQPVTVSYDNLKQIKDKDGEPVSEPVLLDGNGMPLCDPSEGAAACAKKPPVWLPFRPYLPADFNKLFHQLGFPLVLSGYHIEAIHGRRKAG